MNNWLIVFLYCIACYGLSNLFVFGDGWFHIFSYIRSIASKISEHFGKLFQCMMCFSSNAGIFLSLIDWFLIPQIAFTPFNIMLASTGLWWLAMLFDCCFTSGIVWIIHHIELFFENIAEGTVEKDNNNDDENTILLND